MSTAITVHLWLGTLVVVLAVLAVWRRPGRRVTLYVVTLQILVGLVIFAQGARVGWPHAVFAALGWAGYMAANAVARRAPQRRTALIIAAASSLLLLAAFGLGEMAAHRGG